MPEIAKRMGDWFASGESGKLIMRPSLAQGVGDWFGDWWRPVACLSELPNLPNGVIQVVEPMLKQLPAKRQSIAAYVILRHDRAHPAALAVLRHNMSTGEFEDRLFAGRLLFDSIGETNGLCAWIEDGLKSPETLIAQTAAQIGNEIGDAALPLVPVFKAALWDKDGFVREQSGLLILKLAPQELPINERK